MNRFQKIEFLTKIKDVLTPEGAWCQGAAARKADGSIAVLEEDVRKATSFCLIGAAQRVCGVFSGLPVINEMALRCELMEYAGLRDGYGIATWNDAKDRTQSDVLAFLNTRISHLKDQL